MATRVAGSKHYFKSGGTAYFYTWVEYEVTSQTESGTYYKWRRGVYSYGDWAGSTLQFDSWCSGKSLTSGSSGSEVATTSWTTGAYLAYGSSRTFSWDAGYYGSSTTHRASLSTKWTPATPTWTPNAPSGLSHSRASDVKNSLSWTNNATTTRPYSSIKVERQVDGGSWSQVASVSGAATGYSDTTASANHRYSYRIRAYNSAGYSPYTSATATTYNTPAAPSSVSSAVKSGTTVTVTVANPAATATSLELQKSADGSSWSAVATAEGSPVTSLDADLGGGEWWLRARNLRGSLASEWTASASKTVTECPPAAPSLVSPPAGAVVSKADEHVEFSWLHNPVDGSAQTAAKLRYSTDGGATWTEVEVAGGAGAYSLDNAFAVNSEVTWGACTKGADEDHGPWSGNRVFHVRQAPSVAFAQPADGFTVENMPIAVELQYADPSGDLASASLAVSDGAGTVVYRRDMGTATACSVGAGDWLPESGAVYTLVASVRSTSTLEASCLREVAVDFVPPQPAELGIEPDAETGYVVLSVSVQADGHGEEPASISVYRACGGERVLLGEGLSAGAAVVDKYAPLNEDYRYEAVTFAASGAVNSTAFDARVDTPWAFLYFPGGGIARGMWDPGESWKIKQDAEYVQYAGREYPVAYLRDGTEETHSVTVALPSREEAAAFRRMMAAHEPVVAKLWDALVFHAVPQVQGKPRSAAGSCWGEVSVDLTRVDGDAL